MHSYRVFMLIILSAIITLASIPIATPNTPMPQQPTQRLVESVDITGNRSLRKDDVLYYIQTRQGDPYNEEQMQRDLLTLLATGFFR